MDNELNFPLPPGTKLFDYTITRELSSGGFGKVYLAESNYQKSVAIKEFLPSIIPCRTSKATVECQCKTPSESRRFKDGLRSFFKEAELMSKIKCHHVVSILDIFELNGTAYYVMPLEIGETLQTKIRREAPLSDAVILSIFSGVITGVKNLHAMGMLHLDIKPSNIWIRPDGHAVVLDLGASRVQESYRFLSPPVKTPGFAAPEQHGPSRSTMLTEKTDIYGVCASMWSCIEGRSPPVALERKKNEESMFHRWRGQYSFQLLELIDWGMQILPENRPNNMIVLKEKIKAINFPKKTNRQSLNLE